MNTIGLWQRYPLVSFPELIAEYMVSSIQTHSIRKRKRDVFERDEYATITNNRHHGISTELLARKWGIGLNKAKATLKGTTQKAIRSAVLPLTRRYRTDLMQQRLRRLRTTWYTDTLFAKEKSIAGN